MVVLQLHFSLFLIVIFNFIYDHDNYYSVDVIQSYFLYESYRKVFNGLIFSVMKIVYKLDKTACGIITKYSAGKFDLCRVDL